MVKTSKALIASGASAATIGFVHYAASHWIFNNPALEASNKTIVGFVVAVSVFTIGFVGMKWNDWS